MSLQSTVRLSKLHIMRQRLRNPVDTGALHLKMLHSLNVTAQDALNQQRTQARAADIRDETLIQQKWEANKRWADIAATLREAAKVDRPDTAVSIVSMLLSTFFIVVSIGGWLVGIVLAQGFWQTLGAIFPPYAWYVVVETLVRHFGWLASGA